MSADRLLLAAAVVFGVPPALGGYIALVEYALRRGPRRLSGRFRPWLWLLPAFALLGLYLVYPAITTIINSLQDARSDQWVGLRNYRYVFTNSGTLSAMRNNVLWVVFF